MPTPTLLRLTGALLALLGFVLTVPEVRVTAPVPSQAQGSADDELTSLLAAEGIHLDREAGAVALRAQVLVTNELLEYLLVTRRGATHESLLMTEVTPSLLNAGLFALGLEPGTNMRTMAGADGEAELVLPAGEGVLPYVAWQEGGELYVYRVEDVLCDLAAERSMRRHRWVFLGSGFKTYNSERGEEFVADVEGNLINLAFFSEGSTLATSALPECLDQTIWGANDWLLPPRGEEVLLILAKERLDGVPAGLRAHLPTPARARVELPDPDAFGPGAPLDPGGSGG